MAGLDVRGGIKSLSLYHRIFKGWGRPVRLIPVLLVLSLVSSCTFLSDKQYVEQNSHYRGIRRVAVFLQRWPVNQQLSGQGDLGEDFIKRTTLFLGPWTKGPDLNPRDLDVQDIDDNLMGEIILEALQKKGYQPFLSAVLGGGGGAVTVEAIMARYQVLDPGIDAFLFCFYAPRLFLSQPPDPPLASSTKAYGLQEITAKLGDSNQGTIWAGPRAAKAPENSISHAFIYISMTMFKARDWSMLWEVAGSHTGGRSRPWIPQCPPGPTDQNYWADAEIIQTLMSDNLKCRLRHLIPYAF